MERVNVLIDKLNKQRSMGENADQLLVTVQLLQQELLKLQKPVTSSATSKVAVVMPTPRVFDDELTQSFSARSSVIINSYSAMLCFVSSFIAPNH